MRSDPRLALERLIRERGEDYASISRLLGRNAAYSQQFIKRGTPRRLQGKDRKLLAQYFGVSDVEFGAAGGGELPTGARIRPIPRLDVSASAARVRYLRTTAANRI
jgi:hypothetical protein